MLVSRISPAPRRAASSRPGHERRDRVARAAAVGVDRPAGAVRLAPCVDRDDDALAAEARRRPRRSASGSLIAAVLIETLSAPAGSSSRMSSTRAHAAANGERDEHLLGRPLHHVDHRSRLSDEAVMSRKTSSSAPSRS